MQAPRDVDRARLFIAWPGQGYCGFTLRMK